MQTATETKPIMNQACAADLPDNVANLLKATIMMVDDEPITMEVVQAFLEDAGYQHFVLVDDPREAMATLEETRPDLLLLDLMMPEISGFEILQALRERDKFKHLPVLILSSTSDNADKLQALDLGATDLLSKPVDPSELQLRVRNTLAAKAYQDQLAYYDILTNLPNRLLFVDRLEHALDKSRRDGSLCALLFLDLDRFKDVNDTFGHPVGDRSLEITARRLVDALDPGTLVGRLAGDEFAILLDALPSGEDLHPALAATARMILDRIAKEFYVERRELFVTASLGIALCPDDADNVVDLIRNADAAMYRVKQARGGRAAAPDHPQALAGG